MRARFIGGRKDQQVIDPFPNPPPPYWADGEGEYELFGVIDDVEAVYRVPRGGKRPRRPAPAGDTEGSAPEGWSWQRRAATSGAIRARPVRARR